jgi:hypothetical protein
MRDIYIIAVEYGRIQSVKAVRAALEHLNGPNAYSEARQLLDHVNPAKGEFSRLGGYENPQPIIAALREAGVVATSSSDPADAQQSYLAKRASANGATPEQVFAEFAPGEAGDDPEGRSGPSEPDQGGKALKAAYASLSLMQFAEGAPLVAGVHAATLANLTPDSYDLWQSAQQLLIGAFPWAKDTLEENGVLL